MTDINLAELAFGDDDEGWNQACRWGHLVEGHAVYCHCPEERWPDSPRKCFRTWATGGQTRDEDCEGFEPQEVPHA